MAKPRPRPRIVMAVHNPGHSDNRVRKSAEAAARAGYDVHVVGLRTDDVPERETINGVTYHRVPFRSGIVLLLGALYPVHSLMALVGIGESWHHLRRMAHRLAGATRHLAARPARSVLRWVRSHGGLLRTGPAHALGSRSKTPGRWLTVHPAKLGRSVARTMVSAVRGTARRSMRGIASTSLKVLLLRGYYLCSLFDKLRELRGDVYHAHELWTLESCVLAGRESNAAVLYDSHELEAHRNAPWKPPVRKSWVDTERRYIRRADCVVAVSDGCASELRRAYGLPCVHVIRNTPLSRFDPAASDVRAEAGLPGSTPLAVYVGSVTLHRGLKKIVSALAHLPEFHLATVGPSREETVAEVLALAEGLGVRNRVHILPKVPPDAVVNFISTADVGVMAIQNVCLSYYHCLPNKLFESAFAGVPVVASDFPDMRRFVEAHDIGETCDPTDPRCIADAMRRAYARRDQYYTPEKIQTLRREHCFEQEARKLVALYQHLVVCARRRRS